MTHLVGGVAHLKQSRRGAALLGLVALTVLAVIGLVAQYDGRSLRDSKLLIAPQSYVAIAMVDPGHLPTRTGTGGPVQFGFSIDNETARELRQPWLVTVRSSDGVRQARSGMSMLASGASKVVDIEVALPRAASTVSIAAVGSDAAPLLLHFQAAP